MSLMSSSLLLQQYPACFVRLTWIVFVIGGRCPYRCCFCGMLSRGLVHYYSQHSCVIKSNHRNHQTTTPKITAFRHFTTFCRLFILQNHHHHHHVMLVARIYLTLSHHFSLSFIASGRSSGQHPVSSHSCWMYVRAGRPAFARSCVGVHTVLR